MRLYLHPIIIILLLPLTTGLESTPHSTLSTPIASTCPFTTPLAQLPSADESQQNPLLALLPLQKRQAVSTSTGQCPAGFFGCSNYGAPQACCANTAICTTDQVNHVACCASGASCTGIIGSGTLSSPTTIGAGTTTTTAQGSPNQGGTVVASSGVVIVTAGAPVGSAASAVALGKDGKARGSAVALVVAVGIAVAGLV